MSQPQQPPLLGSSSAANPSLSLSTASQAPSANAPARRPIRIGYWVLGLTLAALIVWGALAPLDEGIPSPATVTVDTKRKPVQHLQGGVVTEVLVREGQIVKSGQVLIRLDPATAKAVNESTRQKYLGLLAMEGRFKAEQAGKSSIVFHPELIEAAKNDLALAQGMQHQLTLLQTRQRALHADVASFEQSIQGNTGMLTAYKGMLEGRQLQMKLLSEELAHTRTLVSDGYAPRNRQLELERQFAESRLAVAELQGNIVRAQSAVDELRQRIISRQQDYRKEVDSGIADVTREIQTDAARLAATTNDLARTEIRAPADGQVIGLAIQTVGSVVSPGMKLMDIVPEHEPLVLEARVDPRYIDRVHVDLPVDIRFSAFAHAPQLVIEGHLFSVSQDLIADPQNTTPPFYLARVRVTPDGMKKLGKLRLQPGMAAEVILKTGERSVITYMLHPLTKRIAGAMKEE